VYRIRFHGRGGQGIKTASQVLGSALFAEGFEVQDAPRYGAERRGAPLFATVRAGRQPVRERGAMPRPDLIVLVDPTLAALPQAGVLLGAEARTVLLGTMPATIAFPGTVIALPPAGEGYAATAAACAAARLLGVVGRSALVHALEHELGTAPTAALAAYDAMAAHEGIVREHSGPSAPDTPDWIDVPLEDVALAAPGIRHAGSSAAVPTGLWRTLRPVIDHEACNRCHWVCGTYCPDSAIRVDAAGRPEIDYEHCKGCMVCVSVCPPHAIHAVPERQP